MNVKLTFTAFGGLSLAVLPLSSVASSAQERQQRMNVLMLIADDLRPELGCYGVEGIRTPNIDALASSGTRFSSAYCNCPVSGASRASLFTGMYPKWPVRFIDYESYASKDAPEAMPLPGCFTEGGYHTVSNGKVFHNITDFAQSWSEYPWRVHPDGYGHDWAEYNKWELWMNSASGGTINSKTMRGPFCESADVEDDAYADGKLALHTIEDLKRLKDREEPFFLACGFWRPHLPFNAPKRYWDLYNRDDIPLADNQYRSLGLPDDVIAPKEIFSYARVDNLEEIAFQKEAKHGYWACVSYIDAQVGKILDALDSLDLSDNTIVIFFGDHGWQLGEHTFWGKHTLMDRATRVPLIVRVPGMSPGVSDSPVELVDLYPTLCELCGLKAPEGQLDGKSFVPVLNDPAARTKDHVFIQWQGGDNLTGGRYNYAEWDHSDGTVSRMLFDHQRDPEENENVAGRRRNRGRIKSFSAIIKKIKSGL